MKKLITYQSKWGSTAQYAKWINQAIKDAAVLEVDDLKLEDLNDYTKIVLGSGTYMGKIGIQGFLERNWETLKNKEVFLFSVGILPAESKESKATYEAIPPHIRKDLAGYSKLPGKIDLVKLNLLEKVIIKLRKPEEFDKISKESIEPIVKFLKS